MRVILTATSKRGLKLFDTMKRRKVAFHSSTPGKVKMFVCGPTVQDYAHVGHARTYLFYDMLARYLSFLGHEVDLVVNITDIDEGIVKGARSAGVGVEGFVEKYLSAFIEDMESLRIRSVRSYDRVSGHVPEVIRQVKGLLANGSAYRVDRNVYFSVDTFPAFGSLSHLTPYQLSLRPLEIAAAKRNQTDFSLWRAGGEEEQKWDSPWGRGTPGWHIQDTAVSYEHFGARYDIHGGARELVYPHHEAEIAQMESLTGTRPMVRYWVHSGLLTQRSEKMSKSKGNTLWIRDAVKEFGPDAMRLYFLSMHHTRDAEFSEKALREWQAVHLDMRKRVGRLVRRVGRGAESRAASGAFLRSMDDDLAAGRAIRRLRGMLNMGEDSDRRAKEAVLTAAAASAILGVDFFEKGN